MSTVEILAVGAAPPPTVVTSLPHSEQNFVPGASVVPQRGQVISDISSVRHVAAMRPGIALGIYVPTVATIERHPRPARAQISITSFPICPPSARRAKASAAFGNGVTESIRGRR